MSVKLRTEPREAQPTIESREKFLAGMFMDWHTGLPHEIELPKFPEPKGLSATCVQAGVWNMNLKDATKIKAAKAQAQGKTQKRVRVDAINEREREEDDDDERPIKKRQIVRLASGKAFLTVTVDEDDSEVKWLWKDECGQAASGVTAGIRAPGFPKREKLWESSVEGGTWIQDLFGDSKQDEPAESPTKKRKRQVEDNQGSPKKMRQNRKDARRSSAKAFLSVIVNEKSGEPRWQWKWKDFYGQAAPNDLVKFREGLTLEGWKIRCLRNYDYHEQRLTDNYNRELAMASARQLIIQWAKDGSASNEKPIVHISSCTKLREPKLVAPPDSSIPRKIHSCHGQRRTRHSPEASPVTTLVREDIMRVL